METSRNDKMADEIKSSEAFSPSPSDRWMFVGHITIVVIQYEQEVKKLHVMHMPKTIIQESVIGRTSGFITYEMQPKILIDFSEHHLNRSLIEKKLLLYIATVPPRIVSYARTHLMPTSRWQKGDENCSQHQTENGDRSIIVVNFSVTDFVKSAANNHVTRLSSMPGVALVDTKHCGIKLIRPRSP